MAALIFAVTSGAELENAAKQSLEKPLRKEMRILLDKYRCVQAVEPVEHVLQKVEDVKVTVDSNIKKLLNSQARLEDLESKTETLAKSALEFSRNATETKKTTSRSKKLITIALGTVFIIFTLCVIFVASECFSNHVYIADSSRANSDQEKTRVQSGQTSRNL